MSKIIFLGKIKSMIIIVGILQHSTHALIKLSTIFVKGIWPTLILIKCQSNEKSWPISLAFCWRQNKWNIWQTNQVQRPQHHIQCQPSQRHKPGGEKLIQNPLKREISLREKLILKWIPLKTEISLSLEFFALRP